MDEYLIRPSDAINAAIEAMDKHCNGYNSFRDMRIRKAIEGVPSAGRPQEWIPCSERLPKEDGRYYVTRQDYVTQTDFTDILWYEKGLWWNRQSIGDYAVIAWMPLPKPWKGADDE